MSVVFGSSSADDNMWDSLRTCPDFTLPVERYNYKFDKI